MRYMTPMTKHPRVFEDRSAAGVALAQELQGRLLQPPLLVLGLPRGGVPAAYEVARLLNAPLDVMLVRKIGMPGQPELAIGAIASGNVVVHEPRIAREIPNLGAVFDHLVEDQRRELERREKVYRPGLAPLELEGKTVILIDDGLATGSTMLAAIRASRKAGAARIVVGAPVASPEAAELIRGEADAASSWKLRRCCARSARGTATSSNSRMPRYVASSSSTARAARRQVPTVNAPFNTARLGVNPYVARAASPLHASGARIRGQHS